ncbi:unnamed protein product, partial [Amoebophrya sp. A25]
KTKTDRDLALVAKQRAEEALSETAAKLEAAIEEREQAIAEKEVAVMERDEALQEKDAAIDQVGSSLKATTQQTSKEQDTLLNAGEAVAVAEYPEAPSFVKKA